MNKLKILIVDDSTSARKLIKELLKPLDAEIAEAADGQMGFDLSLESHFDVIITDIDMPRMNGVKFCRRLKSTSKTKSVPVIIVSSFDSDREVDSGFQAGASAYISKKEARNLLLETVEKTLSKYKFQYERLVMVVDDSYSIRLLVEDALTKAGFEVITAKNGKIALELIKKKRPDLILSDINMPEMDGFALLDALQSDPNLSLIPFTAISIYSDRGHMKRMIQHGAASYIIKPFNMDQLVILVEKLLSDQFLLLLKERERLDTEQSLMLASITSLVSALEARDSYTRGHSETVASMISGMLSITGAGKKDVERIAIGGRLHDIGKIGVRDSILLKPGQLSEDEFNHIKEHPMIGTSILAAISSLADIVPIVLSHHERLDGKGYPQGLKGNKIPQWARMTAVADTYHALVSDRSYRKGMGQEKALQIIEDVRGTQLCPDCIDLFFRWIASKEGC